MSVFGCFELDFDIETVRFLYAKNKAFKTPFYVNEPTMLSVIPPLRHHVLRNSRAKLQKNNEVDKALC